MSGNVFIAVDWGTTNRRAYLIDDGCVVRTEHDALGIRSVPRGGFAAAAAALRAAFGDPPMLLAGMVGSTIGWADAGYVECPATLADLARQRVAVADGIEIVPGVKSLLGGRGDVMRGEEVQLLGAVADGLVPGRALLCQPGTHTKWARMAEGAITAFTTSMTGELFAILKDHALIGSAMTGAVTDGPAFREGIARSGENDLLAALFGVRPASLLGLRPDTDAASFVSGLLIGSDARAQAATGETVYLLSDPVLGTLYAKAIEAVGGSAVRIDSHAAFIAGISRIWELSR